LRSRPGKSRILPASPTDLRTLVENYVYPLIVCEEEGKIVFFNGAAQVAFGETELLGRPLPPAWMDSEEVQITTADAGAIPFRLIWEEILWDGNVAWYLAAVPSVGRDPGAEEEAKRLRFELEKSQEKIAESSVLQERLEEAERQALEVDDLRARLETSQEMAIAEVHELQARLERAQSDAAAEVERLQERLQHTEGTGAAELEELQAKLEKAKDIARAKVAELKAVLEHETTQAEILRQELERSAELVAVEAEKRQSVESERDNLEAKLRDLHQRSLSKLEAARSALESERSERDQLSERLSRLKQETDTLRQSLEEKSFEVEQVRNQSGEHFEELSSELRNKTEALDLRDQELSEKNTRLQELQERVQHLETKLESKTEEITLAEQTAERFKRECEGLETEMADLREHSGVLEAKLKSAESRVERYKRLMDKDANEFSRGGDGEREIETLQAQIETLQVELAATVAAARSGANSAEFSGEAIGELEQQCQELREGLNAKEDRIRQLEDMIAAGDGSSNGAESVLRSRLSEVQTVVEELRFHRELEYQEAQSALRDLQERYADVTVNGFVDDGAANAELEQQLSDLEGELQDASLELVKTREELMVKAEIAQSVPLLRERVQTLEEQLTAVKSTGAGSQMSPEMMDRMRELEAEVQRARTEASPEELHLANRRISELEAQIASQPHGAVADSELLQKNRQLEDELTKTREQLADMNQELRRTLEGDRETKKLAYADQLTGLPNLNLTGQYLQVCFERSGRGEGALALILIDLDHFRRVNDALGQKAGDELLKEVGARLQRCVTEKDTAIARRGEDEFMVVAFLESARVDGEALQARVRGIAHNLLNELAKPFDILDQKVQVTASLGVALYPGPATTRLELLEQSEHAMYKAKESGRARVNFYTEEMHNTRARRHYLEDELRQAVAKRQFGMVYQPIYEIASSKVVGIEALLRWNHPQRGVLEPREFLDVAEETGIIVQIGELVIQEALEVAKQKFMKRRFLTLNLSFRQLIDSGFSARFMKHLQVAGVPPHEVIVEISEKAASIDPDRIKNTLAHLAHWGVGIGLDDFGTGHSEINHLTDYTLRVVKIDGSLIGRLPDDRAATKLCQAIAQMSNALEIPVLAEGVETREQLKLIAGMGCQYAQGIILNAPMNVSQLIQVL
jgi:diguanylate cyclase (GGDEF)-like protein